MAEVVSDGGCGGGGDGRWRGRSLKLSWSEGTSI